MQLGNSPTAFRRSHVVYHYTSDALGIALLEKTASLSSGCQCVSCFSSPVFQSVCKHDAHFPYLFCRGMPLQKGTNAILSCAYSSLCAFFLFLFARNVLTHQLSACIFCKRCILTLVHGLADIKAQAVLAHRWWFRTHQRCHSCMTTAASQPQLGNKMKLKIKDRTRKQKCKHFDGCNSSE